jgi:hypothetical protein
MMLLLCASEGPGRPNPHTYLDVLLMVVFGAERQDAQEQMQPWKIAESRL